MALKGLRFAGLEWRNITASKVMWVVIAAIAIMPLLYGALYLAAFQDPYARLNTVPVAVVNEDAGAVIAAESRNLGDDVVDELRATDDGLQWHFVSADEAQRGLEDGTYFMTCTIPSDFSASVASADSDAPRRAQLEVEYNQSENAGVPDRRNSVERGAPARERHGGRGVLADGALPRGRFGQGHPDSRRRRG